MLLPFLASVLVATADAQGVPSHYPPLEFPSGWGNGNIGLCSWLTRVAAAKASTDIEVGRAHVLAALASLNASTYRWLNLDERTQSQIVGAVRTTPCAFNASLAPWSWRAWNDTCLDGVHASPAQHKVLVRTPDIRVTNVYGVNNTIEQFHTHQRLSFFVQAPLVFPLCLSFASHCLLIASSSSFTCLVSLIASSTG